MPLFWFIGFLEKMETLLVIIVVAETPPKNARTNEICSTIASGDIANQNVSMCFTMVVSI